MYEPRLVPLYASEDKMKRSVPSHTKGYYPFSKDFPGDVDERGYRDTHSSMSASHKKRRNRKIIAITFLIVFLLTFIVFYISFSISSYVPGEESSTLESYSSVIEFESESG